VPRLPPQARPGHHGARNEGARRADPGPALVAARARDDGAPGPDRRPHQGEGRGPERAELATARYLQRRAQFYLDFVEAENSTGFHAPQEAARILGESLNYARQGQIALRDPGFKPTVPVVEIPNK
jgi:Cytochrome c552